MPLKGLFLAVIVALIGASFAADDGCTNLPCDQCEVNAGCQWLNCTTSGFGCHNTTTSGSETCVNANCSGNSTHAPTIAPTPHHNTTTTTTVTPSNGTTIAPSPDPHKNTFDAASFIGGIVLVLGLQAVIFFLYKFCKSKERNYHTL